MPEKSASDRQRRLAEFVRVIETVENWREKTRVFDLGPNCKDEDNRLSWSGEHEIPVTLALVCERGAFVPWFLVFFQAKEQDGSFWIDAEIAESVKGSGSSMERALMALESALLHAAASAAVFIGPENGGLEVAHDYRAKSEALTEWRTRETAGASEGVGA